MINFLDLIEFLKCLIVGIILGGIFTYLKLPLPAPLVFNGIVGIFGVYLGFIIIGKFL